MDPRETAVDRRKRVVSIFKNALGEGMCPSIRDSLLTVPSTERERLVGKLVQLKYRSDWDKGQCPTVAEYNQELPEYKNLVEEELLAKEEEGGFPYVLMEKLGEGGCGNVFRACDTATRRDVAIKVLNPDLLSTQSAITMFEREIQIQAGIVCPGVARLYSQGRFKTGRTYMVMQYVPGETLRSVIRNAPKGIDLDRAVRVICAVAEAVHCIHHSQPSRGALMHRDLKPENIVLDTDDNPYVVDFGLAAAVSALHGNQTPVGATYAYSSPEQRRGLKDGISCGDTRCDIWSLGVILYELITGQPFIVGSRDEIAKSIEDCELVKIRRLTQFEGLYEQLQRFKGKLLNAKRPFVGSKEQIMEAIEREDEPAGVSYLEGFCENLNEIIQKCVRKEPGERFQTAKLLASRLTSWLRVYREMMWVIDCYVKALSETSNIHSIHLYDQIAEAYLQLGEAQEAMRVAETGLALATRLTPDSRYVFRLEKVVRLVRPRLSEG